MAKWIKVRDGNYKYVEDTDSRPPVKLPNKKLGSIFIPFQPTWKQHEKDMWNDDTKKSMQATDRFIDEREHEMKTDPKAARWEKSRKAYWDKHKPAWRKWATREGII
jgi:hypothetical protein